MLLGTVGALFWFTGHPVAGGVFWSAAGLVVLLWLVAPSVLAVILEAVVWLGRLLGHAVGVAGLTVVFYTVFLAGSLWLRLTGRDPLSRAFPDDSATFWTPRAGHPPEPDIYRKPYSLPHAAEPVEGEGR